MEAQCDFTLKNGHFRILIPTTILESKIGQLAAKNADCLNFIVVSSEINFPRTSGNSKQNPVNDHTLCGKLCLGKFS